MCGLTSSFPFMVYFLVLRFRFEGDLPDALKNARRSASVYLARVLPLALALRFLLVPAAYSEADKDFIAASGKYRSPVSEDFLPDLVLHFCFVQSRRDCCDFRKAIIFNYGILHQLFYISNLATALYAPTTLHEVRPLNPL